MTEGSHENVDKLKAKADENDSAESSRPLSPEEILDLDADFFGITKIKPGEKDGNDGDNNPLEKAA